MSGLELYGTIVLFATLGIVLFCFIMYTVLQRKRHFLCPRCGLRFKTDAAKAFFASRRGVEKMLTCPNCKMVAYMDNIADSEIPKDDDEDVSDK